MNPMRVTKGKVVGTVVVLEEPLPDGAVVEVFSAGPGDEPFVITEEMHRELDEAEEELAQGGGIDFDEFMAHLPPA